MNRSPNTFEVIECENGFLVTKNTVDGQEIRQWVVPRGDYAELGVIIDAQCPRPILPEVQSDEADSDRQRLRKSRDG